MQRRGSRHELHRGAHQTEPVLLEGVPRQQEALRLLYPGLCGLWSGHWRLRDCRWVAASGWSLLRVFLFASWKRQLQLELELAVCCLLCENWHRVIFHQPVVEKVWSRHLITSMPLKKARSSIGADRGSGLRGPLLQLTPPMDATLQPSTSKDQCQTPPGMCHPVLKCHPPRCTPPTDVPPPLHLPRCIAMALAFGSKSLVAFVLVFMVWL